MKKILIVEDNVSMRFLLESILKTSYSVRTADDGLTAMVVLHKGFVPDLILTDINMPSINGWELITYLKKSNLYGHIPVITLSSDNIKEMDYKDLSITIDDSLQKPFEPKDLLERVSGVLKKKSPNYLTAVPNA